MAMQNPCTFMSGSVKISLSHLSIKETDRQTQVEISTIQRSRERLGRVDSGETTCTGEKR